MIAARAAIMQAGHFEPLTAALTNTASSVAGRNPSLILDIGAGTGYHLRSVLGTLTDARGVALDASRFASRRAARAHPRIAAVISDVWRQIPLTDACVDLALIVFAPRNGAELARVVRPGGTVIVVTPATTHLHELATLHTVRVDPVKPARLDRLLFPWLSPWSVRQITWTLNLSRHEIAILLRMGPAGSHLKTDFEDRLAALPDQIMVTGAVELRTFLHKGHIPPR